MDSPIRKQQKRNDYLRHKVFRKINRRKKAEKELVMNAPMKELRRRLRLKRTFKCGKDAYVEGKDDIRFVEVLQPLYDQYGNLLDPATGMIGTTALPNVEVIADPNDVARGRAKRLFTEFNDATIVADGRPQNQPLLQRTEEDATKAAAWMKDHPILNNIGLAAGSVPFVVASAPMAIGGGELVGQALANPYVDALMTSGFGAHGLQSLMNGTANWETALEIAPLTRLVKPIVKTGANMLDRAFPMPDLRISPRRAGLNIPAQDTGLLDTTSEIENTTPDLLSIALKNTAVRDFENRFVTPGFLIKMLHKGSPLEKQISKTGTVSTNNIISLANKASEMEKYVINKVLQEKFPDSKSVDYVDFKKAVQDELIPYVKHRTNLWADYGMDRLGYKQYPRIDYPRIDAYTFENRKRILRGDNRHFEDRPGTLGHTRTFTTQDNPYTLHVAESQSDWAQQYYKTGEGTENFKSESAKREIIDDYDDEIDMTYSRIKEIDDKIKSLQERYMALPNDHERLFGVGKKYVSSAKKYEEQQYSLYDRIQELEQNRSEKASIPSDNPHKLHLVLNYESRQIIENMKIAAERGQTKMRYPTPDTAAKIEGYQKLRSSDEINAILDELDILEHYRDGDIPEYPDIVEQMMSVVGNSSSEEVIARIELLRNRKADLIMNGADYDYLKEHKTILKKYADFPKKFKKMFKGQDVRTITDKKGNTWYEVDVPKDFLKQEWVYGLGAAVAAGATTLKQPKKETPHYASGKEELPYPLRTSADYDDNLAYQRGILRDPKTGHMWSTTQEEYPKKRIYLKKPNHPTYSKAIWGDMAGGYDVYRKRGRDYAAPNFSELMYTKPPFRYDDGKNIVYETQNTEDGTVYRVKPSAFGAEELNVTTPEVVVTTRDPRKAIPTANGLNISDASSELKRRFYDHITPAGYEFPIIRTVLAALNPGRVKTIEINPRTRRGKTIYPGLISAFRDDLFAEYLQIPKEERHKIIVNGENDVDDNTGEIEETSLRPTNAENDKYFKFKNLSKPEIDRLVTLANRLSVGSNSLSGALRVYLGEHTIGHGHDAKGDYISYYDKWDLAPFTKKGKDLSFGIGKPVNIYDRIYLDDYFGMPKEYRGSVYIPELTVLGRTAKKYANGKDDTINGGILPEIVAIPDNVELVTQYPLKGFTGTKFIGHSSLVSPATEFYNSGPVAGAGKNFINITKFMEDPDYNLIRNNCSDATRNALEKISGKPINSFLFTTPGDVKDFAESELGGITKYEGNGRYRTIIPISKNDRKVLHDLSRKKEKTSFNSGKDSGIHINPKNRGKFNALKKRTGKTTEQLTHSKNPLTRKRAIFALNAAKWRKK